MLSINANEKQNATKRIPVTPSTWERLSLLKRPGESFDDLILYLIESGQKQRLMDDLDVAAAEPSIPWAEAVDKLGLRNVIHQA